jgi:hypothetical protein
MKRKGKKRDRRTITRLDAAFPARDEAETLGLKPVERADQLARIVRVPKAAPCPICQQPMRFGRSEHGWLFRCLTVGCEGKQELGTETGKVVRLLTERLRGP